MRDLLDEPRDLEDHGLDASIRRHLHVGRTVERGALTFELDQAAGQVAGEERPLIGFLGKPVLERCDRGVEPDGGPVVPQPPASDRVDRPCPHQPR